jgi:hypothetical protein
MAINTIQTTKIPREIRGLAIKLLVPQKPQSINSKHVGGLIPLNPIETDCRGQINDCVLVYADSASSDTRKNDFSYFAVDFFDDTAGNVFQIDSWNGSVWSAVNDPFTLGTYYDFNTWDAHQTRNAACIDWKQVLAAHGEGTYRFNVNNELFSYSFELKQWTCDRVQSTVRIEVQYNGLFGDLASNNDFEFNIASTETVYKEQIRLKGGFGREQYTSDSEVYEFANREQRTNKRGLKQSFKLEVFHRLEILRRLAAYGLTSNDIHITEYNTATDVYYNEMYVLLDGSIEPEYTQFSNNAFYLSVNVIRRGDNLGFRACI